MKFKCSGKILRQEIEYANNFSSSKNSLSIISNVLLEASNDILTIKASDNNMGFRSSIPVSVIVPGSTTVFCEKLSAVLKNIPDVDLDISEENGVLNISPSDKGTADFTINIKTIDASKFPELDSVDDNEFFSITQRDYFDMIDKTSFAVADNDSRHFLTGVYMEKKEGKLILVATDGKKLACVRRQFEQDIPDFQPAIIPVRFLNLIKSIGSGEGVFSIAINEGKMFVKIESRLIYSSLITGNYPNYEKVIPKNLEHSLVMKTEDLEKAITLISILAENNSKRIFLTLHANELTVSGENTEFGDSKQDLPCEYNGPENTISFNFAVLQNPIKKMGSEMFRLMYTSPLNAMIFTPEPEKDYLFVLMPMQV